MQKKKFTSLVLILSLLFFYNCTKNEAPNCTITNPLIDEEIIAGAIVNISVDADDSDGNITEVHFYIDNNDVGSTNTFPYSFEWNSFSEEIGIHSIKAKAIDDEGATSTDEIEVEITNTYTDTRDNQTYNIVQIAEQIWMAENLAYLPSVSPSMAESETEPYYYVYDYQGANVSEAKATDNYAIYGVLYNYPAATSACPSGWHLPSDDEWKQLEMAIGMSQSEADHVDWRGTDEGNKLQATDEYGFKALLGGFRRTNGEFYNFRRSGRWWSSTEDGDSYMWFRVLDRYLPDVSRNSYSREMGLSVRCVKD